MVRGRRSPRRGRDRRGRSTRDQEPRGPLAGPVRVAIPAARDGAGLRGCERLDESGLHDQVADAHLAWADDQATRLEADLIESGQSRFTYDLVVDDLRAALAWALHTGQRATGHGLARRRPTSPTGGGSSSRPAVRFEEAASLAADGHEAAQDLLDAGHAASALLQGGLAYERYLEAIDRAEEVGDARTVALALSRRPSGPAA